MSQTEFDKMIDEWVERENKDRGKITIPKLGPYPVDLSGYYGQQMNEWVTTDSIRHYAVSLGDRNPLWWNEDYAKKTRWGGIIAPPTITDFLGTPSSTWRESSAAAKSQFARIVGGCKREWFQAIRPGDRFKCVDKWLGFEERQLKQEPRRFRLFIDTHQRSYINQKDETVAVVDNRFMVMANYPQPSAGGERPSGAGARKRHRFTDEERDAIYRGYDEETRQGADKLYWEDVAEGEELKPLVVGPLSSWDSAAFLAATPGQSVAFDIQWERVKRDLRPELLDPEINAWKPGEEGHLRDHSGHADRITGGYAFGYGAQIEGLICRLLCNWMGDDGFLKRLDCQFRVPAIHGDALWMKGKVTNKSSEGGEHLVALEVHCENQDGLMLVPGKATVRLLSRTQS
jgi:acyl dehydratase